MLRFSPGQSHLLNFLTGGGLFQFIFVNRQKIVGQLAIQERNCAVVAPGRAAAFNHVAFETALPGISAFITELSSHTFTSSLQKAVLV
jgi:hypothetical protein